jgi:hypothetical protein
LRDSQPDCGSKKDDGKSSMSGRVWISSLLSPAGLFDKQGLRAKFYNHEWEPAELKIRLEPDEVYEASKRHTQGFALQRSNFPEAAAVWDEKLFKKIKNIFMPGPFYAVKRKLAEVLSRFDLGDGGLIPFTIYQADLVTPYPGEFFLLNFGCRKNTILPEESKNVVKFAVDHKTGVQYWKVNSWHEDGEVAISAEALIGPDLWVEEFVDNKIFMSDRLAQAIIDIGMKDIFMLKECRIVRGVA